MIDAIKRVIQSISIGFLLQNQKDDKVKPYANISSMGISAISEIVYPYGYYALAPKNSQCLTFNCLSNADNKKSFVYDNINRFKNIEVNEVIIGNQQTKTNIYFKNDGSVAISNNNGSIILENSGDVNINGAIITKDGEIISNSGINLDTHIHIQNNNKNTSGATQP